MISAERLGGDVGETLRLARGKGQEHQRLVGRGGELERDVRVAAGVVDDLHVRFPVDHRRAENAPHDRHDRGGDLLRRGGSRAQEQSAERRAQRTEEKAQASAFRGPGPALNALTHPRHL